MSSQRGLRSHYQQAVEGVDLAEVFGLRREDGLDEESPPPTGYFNMPYSARREADVRALTIGLEVKDLFIEASRLPLKPKHVYAVSGTDYDESRGGAWGISKHEKTIELSRPRTWHRP